MAEKEYIARISYGKDSLKMLEVIKSRGLPLDRITTTDVWATDTISANLPPMDAFKDRMDQRIWDMYRIQVEHLCARNKDGTKRTYEQMFYHVPVRKSGGGTAEMRPKDFLYSESPGANQPSSEMPRYKLQGSIKGFPGVTAVKWCQKLKICGISDQRLSTLPEGERSQMVSGSQDSLCFLRSARRGAETEISSSIWASPLTNRLGMDS